MVFDCRGLGASALFGNLRALRGELIWLHAPEVKLQRPIRLLHPRYSLYIVPRPNNIYLIGASEIEAADYSPISVRTTLELLTAAYYVHSGFAEARIVKTVTHCRPTLSNHLPLVNYAEGIMAINGLYRFGYLIAPALVDAILAFLNNNRQSFPYKTIWELIMISIYFNDAVRQIEATQSLQQTLIQYGYAEGHFAVALNNKLIPKQAYATTNVNQGDYIDVIVAMQGG